MKKDVSKLKTVKNYANDEGVTAAYIYKLIKEGKMDCFIIDGVQFIETDRFPTIPVVRRR
jgi:hypothetical protein